MIDVKVPMQAFLRRRMLPIDILTPLESFVDRESSHFSSVASRPILRNLYSYDAQASQEIPRLTQVFIFLHSSFLRSFFVGLIYVLNVDGVFHSPLLPHACQSVRMKFLAISPGVHSIDTLSLMDIESGSVMNLRSVFLYCSFVLLTGLLSCFIGV